MRQQRVVDEIRTLLEAGTVVFTDQVKQLAADYQDACREANQRLRRCEQFLQKGLRSEAIQLAQAEPVLLDLVATLDFPEREQWGQALAHFGLPAPPRLQLLTAEALNEAYAAVQPLEHLLRQHRLLALTKAALPARLDVMRQIARLDVNSPIWSDDIREFERARLRQVHAEVEHAVAGADAGALLALCDEVRKTAWLETPSADLVKYVEEAARQMLQTGARKALQRLQSDLAGAFAAFEVERGRKLREEWNDLTAMAGLALTDPLRDRVAPALNWLEREDRRQTTEREYQEALGKLEAAVTGPTTRDELDKLARELIRHKRGISPDLKKRLRERLARLDVASQRRERLILVGVAAGVALFLAGLFTHLTLRRAQAREEFAAVEAVESLLARGEYENARARVNDLLRANPQLTGNPDFKELVRKLEAEEARRLAAAGVPDAVRQPGAEAEGGLKPLVQSLREKLADGQVVEVREALDRLVERDPSAQSDPDVADLRRHVADKERERVSEAVKSLDELAKAGKAAEARQGLDRLLRDYPSAAKDPDVSRLREQLKGEEK
jgi:hypothetical protein